jgi:hypothetical protein
MIGQLRFNYPFLPTIQKEKRFGLDLTVQTWATSIPQIGCM